MLVTFFPSSLQSIIVWELGLIFYFNDGCFLENRVAICVEVSEIRQIRIVNEVERDKEI